jgi:hypothetical protein
MLSDDEIARRFANQWDGEPVKEPQPETFWTVLPWCMGLVAVLVLAFVWGQG